VAHPGGERPPPPFPRKSLFLTFLHRNDFFIEKIIIIYA
jgi:hypothetical protein